MAQRKPERAVSAQPTTPASSAKKAPFRKGSEKDAIAARQRRERELRNNPYKEPDLGGVANLSHERPYVSLVLDHGQAVDLLNVLRNQRVDTALTDYISEKISWTAARNRVVTTGSATEVVDEKKKSSHQRRHRRK